jgi:hypothetical protein
MAASKAARPEVHAPRSSIASLSPREHIRRPAPHRTAHVRPHLLRAHACRLRLAAPTPSPHAAPRPPTAASRHACRRRTSERDRFPHRAGEGAAAGAARVAGGRDAGGRCRGGGAAHARAIGAAKSHSSLPIAAPHVDEECRGRRGWCDCRRHRRGRGRRCRHCHGCSHGRRGGWWCANAADGTEAEADGRAAAAAAASHGTGVAGAGAVQGAVQGS